MSIASFFPPSRRAALARTLLAAVLAGAVSFAPAAEYYLVVPNPAKAHVVKTPKDPITVTLAPGVLPGAQVGAAYSTSLAGFLSVTGDSAYDGSGVSWSLGALGALPAGLTLAADGTISGTPTTVSPGSGESFEVSASYNGQSGQRVYTVKVGEALPAATLTTPSFGTVGVGSSAQANATLTNTGAGTLSVTAPTSASVTGADYAFVSSTCPASLAAGASCAITVKFSPTSVGVKTGDLSLATGAGTKSVALSGTGFSGALALTPASIDFGNVQAGSGTAPRALTLTNTDAAAQVGSIQAAFSGAAGGFTQTSDCPAVLAPGATCTISASFTATDVGAASATLQVTSDASNGAQTASLTASVSAPSATLAVPSFGTVGVGSSAQANATLTNTGAGALSVTAPTGASVTGADYAFVSSSCPASLAAGASCAITVKFSPTSVGVKTGDLSLATGAGTKSVALSGTGAAGTLSLSPLSVSFGSVQVGASVSNTLYLKNNSSYRVDSISVSLNGGGASASSSCPSSLGAGQSCSITLTFSPTSATSYSQFLYVYSNASNGAQGASVSGQGVAPSASLSTPSFGQIGVGSTTQASATLTNTGIGYLSISGASVSGSDFRIASNGCGGSLAPGGSCNIAITFAPSSAGTKSGGLAVYTGAGTKSVSFSGTAVTGTLSLSPSSVDFSAYEPPATQTKTLTLTNTGSAAVNSISVSSWGAGISASSSCPASLSSGQSCTIAVTVNSAYTSISGGVSVYSNASNGTQSSSVYGTIKWFAG